MLIVAFILMARYLTKKLSKRYDENTITPSDYTLYIHLSPSQSKKFDNEFYNPASDVSRGQQFRDLVHR